MAIKIYDNNSQRICKDCIHYAVCGMTHRKTCKDYADKDLFIKVKCKRGDKVYCFDYGETKVVENTIRAIKPYVGIDIIYSTEYHTFNEEAFGESVFFSREEAEKKLEEINNGR